MTFRSCALLPETTCNICFEGFTLVNQPWGHEDGGEKHPSHSECIKKWIETKPTCPTCSIKATIEIPLPWKQKAIACMKCAVKVLACSGAASGYVFLVKQEGGAFVAQIVKSRCVWGAAGCAALCVQQEIGSGRLHRLRSFLTATSVFVGLNAGAAIGAAAHSSTSDVIGFCGALVGLGATFLAANEYSALKVAATSSTVTGLVSALFAGTALKDSVTGTLTGAMTGALAVSLSAIAIPVATATCRFLYSRTR